MLQYLNLLGMSIYSVYLILQSIQYFSLFSTTIFQSVHFSSLLKSHTGIHATIPAYTPLSTHCIPHTFPKHSHIYLSLSYYYFPRSLSVHSSCIHPAAQLHYKKGDAVTNFGQAQDIRFRSIVICIRRRM